MPQDHPIRIVARRTGLSAHVIRIWEKRYGAVKPRRSPGNRRFYTDEDVERLLLLRQATASGRTIGQVVKLSRRELLDLLHEDRASDTANAPSVPVMAVEDSVEAHVAACLHAARKLDAGLLESALSRAAAAMPRPVFLEQFVVQLMGRIGEGWREGTIRVTHEHLLSSALRTRLGVPGAGYAAAGFAPLLLVTTPSGQLHEMGALIVAAVAADDGWRVSYPGPNLPAEEIAYAAHQQKATAVALSVLYPADDARLEQEFRRLRQAIDPAIQIVVGGSAAGGYQEVLKEIGAVCMGDIASLRKYLESLRRKPRR